VRALFSLVISLGFLYSRSMDDPSLPRTAADITDNAQMRVAHARMLIFESFVLLSRTNQLLQQSKLLLNSQIPSLVPHPNVIPSNRLQSTMTSASVQAKLFPAVISSAGSLLANESPLILSAVNDDWHPGYDRQFLPSVRWRRS
jgi:hypothetical protein